MIHLTYLYSIIVQKKRRLTDFYIPSLLNDMKIAVQINHLGLKFYTEM